MHRFHVLFPIACIALASSCRSQPGTTDHADAGVSLVGTVHAAVPPPAVKLDPAAGAEIGLEVEAFLSPHQEPEEEANTPKGTPEKFRSTAPSKTRNEREAAGHRGHGKVRFSRDLSRAYVDVKLEGIAVDTINMFHIHCGKPGILGPILVDFALVTDLQEEFADGTFSVEVTNTHIVQTAEHGHGLVDAFTSGCIIPSPSLSGPKPSKVSTVAGMAMLAEEGELYFNLHTKGQTFYGDVRGQILEAD